MTRTRPSNSVSRSAIAAIAVVIGMVAPHHALLPSAADAAPRPTRPFTAAATRAGLAPRVATTRYVSAASGSDTSGGVDNTCASQGTPCLTIQHAITESAPGDLIDIGGGVYVETLTITQSLSLSGGDGALGAGATIVDAGATGSVATISNTSSANPADVTVSFSALTLQSGLADLGGGIAAYTSTVSLANTTVQSNTARIDGGGIFATGGGTFQAPGGGGVLTLSDSLVANNTAGSGGGIYTYGYAVSLDATQVMSNASGGNGDPGVPPGQSGSGGGGIFAGDGPAFVRVTNSQIVSNTTVGNGGGIFNLGGPGTGPGFPNSFTDPGSPVTVTNSQIMSNTAGGNGGAISDVGQVSVTTSQIVSNTATGTGTGGRGGAGVGVPLAGPGGGIAARDGIVVNGGQVALNTSTNGGGGLIALGPITATDAAHIVNNTTTNGGGGGIASFNVGGAASAVTVMNGSRIAANSARFGGGGIAASGFGFIPVTPPRLDSAAVLAQAQSIGGVAAVATVRTLATRAHTSPAGLAAAALAARSPIIIGPGPGTAGALTVSDSAVVSNTATSGGGGGISTSGLSSVTNSTIASNTATTSDGGGIYVTTGGPGGPGEVDLALDSSLVTNNSAPGNDGGGIFVRGAPVTVTNSTVDGNTASVGGGLYPGTGSTMTVTDSAILSNTATSSGGGIGSGVVSGDGGVISLTNTTVGNNTAAVSGGGIANTGTLSLLHATVAGNSAPAGGGLDNTLALTASVTDTILAGNTGSAADCTGPAFGSGGYNLLGPGCAATTSVTGDLTAVTDPRVGPVQDNGGPTPTKALLPDSPAIDRVPVANCPVPTDQRGFTRPFPPGGNCDTGAYEYQPIILGLTPTSGPTAGGTQVTIGGYDLEGTSALSTTFGGVPSNGVTIDPSGHSIVATSPPHSAGTVDVQVGVQAGNGVDTTAITPGDQFTYIAPPATSTSTPTNTATATATPVPPTSTPTATNSAAPPTITGTATPSATPTTSPVAVLPPQQYYFAGGVETASEHATIALLNSGSQPASVRLTFYFANGATDTKLVSVAAHSVASVAVASIEQQRGSFGLNVTATSEVIPQLNLIRDGRDGDSLFPVRALNKTWYLAEGYTGVAFHETVTIFNPDMQARAHVALHVYPLNGHSPHSVSVTVAPHAETVVDINRIMPRRSLSIVTTSDHPVVVERTLTFSRDGHGQGYGLTTRMGATTSMQRWLFAEGTTVNRFQTFLTILNPGGKAVTVTARFYGLTGGSLGSRTRTVPAYSRINIKLNDFLSARGIASVVTSDRPIVVERPEYFGSPNDPKVAGSDVFGRTDTSRQWSFPGGDTQGNDEYLLIYNPQPRTMQLTATFYGSDGRTFVTSLYVPPTVRYNVDVNATLGRFTPLHGAVLQAANGQGFVAEQTTFAPNHSTLRSTQGDPAP